MKKIVSLIAILALLMIVGCYIYVDQQEENEQSQNFKNWRKFIPRSHLFKILLPHSPQYAKDFLSIPNSDKKRRYDMYASEKIDGTLFLVSVINYPSEIDLNFTADVLRDNIQEFMHNRPGNQLVKLVKGIEEGAKSYDFRFEKQDFRVEGKAILDDHTVYMLTYIAHIDNFDSNEYDYFIHSFQILGKAHQKS